MSVNDMAPKSFIPRTSPQSADHGPADMDSIPFGVCDIFWGRVATSRPEHLDSRYPFTYTTTVSQIASAQVSPHKGSPFAGARRAASSSYFILTDGSGEQEEAEEKEEEEQQKEGKFVREREEKGREGRAVVSR